MDMDWVKLVYNMLDKGDTYSSGNMRYAKDEEGVMFVAKYDVVGGRGSDMVEYFITYVIINPIDPQLLVDDRLNVDYAYSKDYANVTCINDYIDNDFTAFMDNHEYFIE